MKRVRVICLFFAVIFLALFLSLQLVSASTLKVTSEHPFLVNNSWISAKNLNVGDKLVTSDGKTARITKITWHDENVDVFNLEAGIYHNFVLGSGLIVHNSYNPAKPIEDLRAIELTLTQEQKLEIFQKYPGVDVVTNPANRLPHILQGFDEAGTRIYVGRDGKKYAEVYRTVDYCNPKFPARSMEKLIDAKKTLYPIRELGSDVKISDWTEKNLMTDGQLDKNKILELAADHAGSPISGRAITSTFFGAEEVLLRAYGRETINGVEQRILVFKIPYGSDFAVRGGLSPNPGSSLGEAELTLFGDLSVIKKYDSYTLREFKNFMKQNHLGSGMIDLD